MAHDPAAGVFDEFHETTLDVQDRFIDAWADIAALWGVAKSIGRVHALLYLSPRPLSTDELTDRLQISHGNASTSLRDLMAWGVVRRVHRSGERKAYFEAEQDPWRWFHTCIEERKRREVRPVQESLHDVRLEAERALETADGAFREELTLLHGKVERFTDFMDQFLRLIDLFLALGPKPMGQVLSALSKIAPKRGG